MNVLLAHSERDFLQSYQKLLIMEGCGVTTAFDGAQAAAMLERSDFQMAVVEEDLPRIDHANLLKHLEDHGIPVIMLLNRQATIQDFMEKELPNAYLTFPFLPEDLFELIREVSRKTNSEDSFRWDEAEVDVPGFCFAGTDIRLTNGEINLMKNWTDGKQNVGKRTRTMIQALNEKLSRIGRKARIEYETGKGYRLVSNHE